MDEGFQLKQRDIEKSVSDVIRSRIRERIAHHDQTAKCDDRYSYRRLGGTSISGAAAGNLPTGNHRQGGSGGATMAYSFAGAGAAAAASSTVETLFRSQTRPTTPLVAADWQAVLRHVYKGAATADAKTVGFLVKEAISTKLEEKKGLDSSYEPGSREGGVGAGALQGQSTVPYGLFLQVLLGYQLHGYLRRLEVFREEFREASIDHHT